jgi:uncharacterized protein (DUF302 family)
MLRLLLILLFVMNTGLPLAAADGLVHVQSTYNVTQTADRLEGILQKKGMTIFNRVKHSESAHAIGVELRDTELIIFGNPKIGSALMQCQQSVAIDLPQKALIWEDDAGTVQITYNAPNYLQHRHNIKGCGTVLEKTSKALGGMTRAAAGQD